jgi:multimeric flavodoxin WrbA
MSRIYGVMGSPRRNGNTHVLLSKVLEGAKDAGAETEVALLNDLRIRECDGCHACWAGRACSKNDDMNPLFDRIAESDAFVFATPVYWYGPTALMKAFIDRFVYFGCPENRNKVKGKPCAIVLPYEEDSPETARLLVEFFEKSLAYLEMPLEGVLLAPGVTIKGEVKDKPDFMREAFALGGRMVEAAKQAKASRA